MPPNQWTLHCDEVEFGMDGKPCRELLLQNRVVGGQRVVMVARVNSHLFGAPRAYFVRALEVDGEGQYSGRLIEHEFGRGAGLARRGGLVLAFLDHCLLCSRFAVGAQLRHLLYACLRGRL